MLISETRAKFRIKRVFFPRKSGINRRNFSDVIFFILRFTLSLNLKKDLRSRKAEGVKILDSSSFGVLHLITLTTRKSQSKP